MIEPHFDADTLARLRERQEVEIETHGSGGAVHRVIIWIVVDDADCVLVRSYRGSRARWFREAVAAGTAGVVVDGVTIPVRVESATDPARVAACSAGFEEKYPRDPATPAMNRDAALDTTLELRPG